MTTNNWSALKTAFLYKASDPANAVSSLTYGTDGSIRDQANRVFSLTNVTQSYNGTVTSLEATSGTLKLPSEAGNYMVVTPYATAVAGRSNPVVSAINVDGAQWNYAYSNMGYDSIKLHYTFDRVQVTGPSNYSKSYVIGRTSDNLQNIVTGYTDELGRTTSYQYDQYARLISASYPEGNKETIAYDTLGNIVQKTRKAKPGSGLADAVEAAFVDTGTCSGVLCFRPVWYRDALNRQTDYVYNSSGQVTEQTDPADAAGARRKTYTTYDAHDTGAGVISRRSVVRICGLGTTCGTNAEIRTEYDYWGHTFLPSVERRIDAATGVTLTTTYSYDSAGRLLVEDGPLPGQSDARYFRYDALGRKTWEIGQADTNGARQARRFTYRDADDRVMAIESGYVTDPSSSTLNLLVRTETSYDARRNPIRTQSSSGDVTYSVTDASFDDRGRTICSTVRMNQSAFGNLPSDACTLGAEGAAGPDRITRNSYDATSQLLLVQKAYGTPIQQDEVTYTYTANGKQASVKDGNGNLATLAYDGFDRQSAWYFPSPTTVGQASATDYEAYGYDAVGNRTSLRKRDGRTIAYAYDGLNRLASKSYPQGGARGVFYTYDVRNLQTAARYDAASGSDAVLSAYDGFGRLTSSTTMMSGMNRTLTYQYDASGNRTRITHPDAVYFSMTYDDASRMRNASWWSPAAGTVPFLAITYDAFGRRVDINRGSSYTGYGYDGLSRLTTQNQRFAGNAGNLNATFGFNPASQITTQTKDNDSFAFTGLVNVDRSYTTNGLNQYVSAGPASFQYDANGNLTADGSRTYGYDVENRLVSVSNGTGLTYDPLGRLWQVAGGPSGTTRFLYDGDALVAEYDGAGGLLRRYMHGPGVDEPILADEGSALNCSGTRFLNTDHQGSVVALADCSGNRQAVDTYDEYGIPGAGNSGRFQYTGQAWLTDLGMYYYKARMYSPTLGRFMQTDPIGYQDQFNLYAYVGNDPVNRSDPTGTKCQNPNTTDCKGVYVPEIDDKTKMIASTRLSYEQMTKLVANNNQSKQDDRLIIAQAYKESRFNPSAKSKTSSATGLMQMTKGAVAEVNRVNGTDYKYSDMTDAGKNIAAGSAYLQIRIDRADGNVTKGLEGFGTGPGYATSILSAEPALIKDDSHGAETLQRTIGR